jgi:tRNA/rRNA methyltransferase
LPSYLTQTRIILIEPAGPRNIGSIARIMKNMGLTQLHLVNPECDPLSDEARHMAVHAAEILETAHHHTSLLSALTGCQRITATLGRDSDRPLSTPRQILPWLTAPNRQNPTAPDCAIIFGREDHGLSNQDLDLAQAYLTIPTSPEYPSLNLAQAVGICCYELQALQEIEPLPEPFHQTPTIDQTENYLQDLETHLLEIGFLQPHTTTARMAKLRDLLKQAHPETPELAMLRGILRQTRWAIANRPKPPSA